MAPYEYNGRTYVDIDDDSDSGSSDSGGSSSSDNDSGGGGGSSSTTSSSGGGGGTKDVLIDGQGNVIDDNLTGDDFLGGSSGFSGAPSSQPEDSDTDSDNSSGSRDPERARNLKEKAIESNASSGSGSIEDKSRSELRDLRQQENRQVLRNAFEQQRERQSQVLRSGEISNNDPVNDAVNAQENNIRRTENPLEGVAPDPVEAARNVIELDGEGLNDSLGSFFDPNRQVDEQLTFSEEAILAGSDIIRQGSEFGENAVNALPEGSLTLGEDEDSEANQLRKELAGGIASSAPNFAGFTIGGSAALFRTSKEAGSDFVDSGAGKAAAGTVNTLSSGFGNIKSEFEEDPESFVAQEAGEEIGEAIGGFLIGGPAAAAASAVPTFSPEVSPEVDINPDRSLISSNSEVLGSQSSPESLTEADLPENERLPDLGEQNNLDRGSRGLEREFQITDTRRERGLTVEETTGTERRIPQETSGERLGEQPEEGFTQNELEALSGREVGFDDLDPRRETEQGGFESSRIDGRQFFADAEAAVQDSRLDRARDAVDSALNPDGATLGTPGGALIPPEPQPDAEVDSLNPDVSPRRENVESGFSDPTPIDSRGQNSPDLDSESNLNQDLGSSTDSLSSEALRAGAIPDISQEFGQEARQDQLQDQGLGQDQTNEQFLQQRQDIVPDFDTNTPQQGITPGLEPSIITDLEFRPDPIIENPPETINERDFSIEGGNDLSSSQGDIEAFDAGQDTEFATSIAGIFTGQERENDEEDPLFTGLEIRGI